MGRQATGSVTVQASEARAIATRAMRRERKRRYAPYLLLLPGGLWLAILFLVPIAVMASISQPIYQS